MCYNMWLFDNDFNMKNSCILDFLGVNNTDREKIAIKKDYDIVLIVDGILYAYVCDNTGRLNNKFGLVIVCNAF